MHRILLAGLLAAATARNALSQTTSPGALTGATLEELMNITITTATRTAEGLAGAPARVDVVTAAQIERRGYRSIADLLKDLPGFKVDLAGDQDYPTELTVDGTRGASRMVLLLNGIRISSPTNEPLPILANYPVHSARQVEIVYGPASALYGADAFSAVINIISNTVDDAPGFRASTSAGQFGLYNETASYGARLGHGATLMVSGQALYDHQPDLSRFYPADFQGLTAQRTGTFNTIFGPMTSSRTVASTYDIPISAHSFEATFRAGGLQLTLFENSARVPTSPAYTPDNAVYNPDAFNLNTLLVGAGSYTRSIGRATSTSTVTFSRHELDPESGYWNVYSNLEKSYKYAYGSMAKAEEQLSWKPAASTTFTVGGTFEHFYAIPQGADLNAPVQSQDVPGTILDTNIPDDFVKLRYANSGAYAQMQYVMSPRVTLTLGARGDYNTRYGGTFNPRLGLVTKPTDRTTLKLLYGTAFLAPSPYQAYPTMARSTRQTAERRSHPATGICRTPISPRSGNGPWKSACCTRSATTCSCPGRRSTRVSMISSWNPTRIAATRASFTGGPSRTSTSASTRAARTCTAARSVSPTCAQSGPGGASKPTPRQRSPTAANGSSTRGAPVCRPAGWCRSSSASAPTSTGTTGASHRGSRSWARSACSRRPRRRTDRSNDGRSRDTPPSTSTCAGASSGASTCS